jgi:hypothetical protein
VITAQRGADALCLLAETGVGSSGRRFCRRRYVIVNVTTNANPAGSRELTEPVTTDGARSAIKLDHGAIGVSRRRRDASSSMRATGPLGPAVELSGARRADRQCRFPGGTSRRCDAPHIRHWTNGGTTSVENLVKLCRRHHRAVHEAGFSIHRSVDGAFAFVDPHGRPLPAGPGQPAAPD